MNVICFEDTAFYEFMERVVERICNSRKADDEKWVSPAVAMKILCIKSKTTLQKLRDEGSIRYTQPERRIILYDRSSLYDYLEAHAKNTFFKKK